MSVRRDADVLSDLDFSAATPELWCGAVPWRTFRWHLGQKHFSGAYWSATTGSHVIYESRLELARLLLADFDGAVRGIIAQPFLLKAEVDGSVRRHVPDFLLFTPAGPVVVDVKPAALLGRAEVAFTLGWTREVLAARGWGFEVFSEPIRWFWRTSASWLATDGPRCSIRSCWKSCIRRCLMA